VTGDGGRRRGVARGDDEQFACTGRRGRGGEAAGENPHRNVELLEHLLNGGEWRSDGAASGRGVEATAAEELGRLRVFGRRRRLRLREELGHEGGGFIGWPRHLGVGCRLDSDLSLSLARGRRWPRQVGSTCQRAKGEGEREQAVRVKLGRGEGAGWATRREGERKS
jgi:hypothetical protein